MALTTPRHWVDVLIRPQCKGFEPYLPGRSIESVRRERGLAKLYKLASNENALGPSKLALKAVAKVGTSILRYPDGASTALRQALAKKNNMNGDRVIVGAGSDELIELLGKTFLNPGDSIVVSQHAFIRYRMAADLMGAATITIPMRDYTHDLTAMGEAIRSNTKMLFIANPNNPTGTFNTHAELEGLLQYTQKLQQRGQTVLVVLDEAYFEFASALDKSYPRSLELARRYSNLVILRTFSKVYALAGLRVGYGFADPGVISAMDRVRPPFNVSTIAQAAAEASLKDRAQVTKGVELVRKGRKQVLPVLEQMGLGVIPSVGNFVLIDVAPRLGSELFEALLERGVIIRAMNEYEFPSHIRVTYGLPAENALFLKALKGGCRPMMLTLKKDVTKRQMDAIVKKIRDLGFTAHTNQGKELTVIGVVGENAAQTKDIFDAMDGVQAATPISKPYKLVSREFHPENTVIKLPNGQEIGGEQVVVMAGPCSVDTKERLLFTAEAVKRAGAQILRGGAFKPRTSPYAFQGHGEKALKMLAEARKQTGLPVITEVMNLNDVKLVEEYADIIQVGARNIQNFDLLKVVGKAKKPVLLKRGLATSIQELLMSAEYIMTNGNYNVMLCERGIRTFETSTRFTLDLNAVPVLRHLSHLPIIVDPSHGVGIREFIPPLARAAVAAGADGLIIEVHPKPEEALSDGPQSLLPDQFARLMGELRAVANAIGRSL